MRWGGTSLFPIIIGCRRSPLQSVNSTLNVERAGRRFARICDMRFSPFENPSGVDLKKFACPSKYPSKRWSVDLWFRAMESNFFFYRIQFPQFYSIVQRVYRATCVKIRSSSVSGLWFRKLKVMRPRLSVNFFNFLSPQIYNMFK